MGGKTEQENQPAVLFGRREWHPDEIAAISIETSLGEMSSAQKDITNVVRDIASKIKLVRMTSTGE